MPLGLLQERCFVPYALYASNDLVRVPTGIPSNIHESPQAHPNHRRVARRALAFTRGAEDQPTRGRELEMSLLLKTGAPYTTTSTSVTEDDPWIKRNSCQNEKGMVCRITQNLAMTLRCFHMWGRSQRLQREVHGSRSVRYPLPRKQTIIVPQ
jgi:hypothetical protein